MADWNNPNPIDTNAGGDTKYTGFVKAQSNFDDIYSKLNIVKKLQTGTTAPSTPAVGELWFDENTGILKRYDGISWVEIVALPDLSNITSLGNILNLDGSGSGLDADTVDGYDTTTTATPNKIPITDANGYINYAVNQGSGSGLDADLVRGLPADFTSSMTTSGYQKLPSGLIIQWGQATLLASGTGVASVSVTFPIAFPTASLIAFAIPTADINTSWGGVAPAKISSLTATGLTAVFNANAHTTFDQDQTIYWASIGY